MNDTPSLDTAARAIDLVVICGFLGTGKTTILQRLAKRHGGRRLLFLVNDFPPRDIDGARLELPEEALATVAGGSVFCRCKSGELVNILKRIIRLEMPPDAVVVEASGIADPRNISIILSENKLEHHFIYRRCCCVVDPVSLLKLRHTLPVVQDQIGAASLVVVNRTDTASAQQLQACYEYIRLLRPEVPVEETCFGQLATDLLSGIDPLPLPQAERQGAGSFACVDCAIAGPVDWPRLRAAIDGMGGCCHRVKGRVPTADGVLDVDWTYGGWHQRPAPITAEATGNLAIITDKPTRIKAERLITAINDGAYAAR